MIAENLESQGDGVEGVRMLNVTDLSKCLRVSVRQVWRLNKDKLLPAPQRIGTRIVRWSASEIAAWLQAGSPPREKWEKQQATQAVEAANT